MLKSLETLQRELAFVRAHNRAGGASLFFAEAALLLMTLERFLRLLPGVNAADKETLPQLLQRAVAIGALRLPEGETGAVIDEIRRFRNSLLHANHEQTSAGRKDYFGGAFVQELEKLHSFVEGLISQVDPISGLRRKED